MQRLDGQVAIVTGGARGIGLGIATVLCREGAKIVIADLDGAKAQQAASGLSADGSQAIAVQVDVTVASAVEQMAAAASQRWGRIDILAANAGVFPRILLGDIESSEWDRVMSVNVKGVLFAVQACLPEMIKRSYGRIVLTSSITGPVVGQPKYSLYGASKAAMLGFMRSAALELVKDGVTVNAVMPGNIATEGFACLSAEHQERLIAGIPLGVPGEPEDVGWAVRYLVSPEARFVTGQTLIIDGGQVLPE